MGTPAAFSCLLFMAGSVFPSHPPEAPQPHSREKLSLTMLMSGWLSSLSTYYLSLCPSAEVGHGPHQATCVVCFLTSISLSQNSLIPYFSTSDIFTKFIKQNKAKQTNKQKTPSQFRAREVAQSVRSLLYKHENLSSNPNPYIKKAWCGGTLLRSQSWGGRN